MSSSFRFFVYPLMPAALHFSMRSGFVFFSRVTRSSCSDVLPAGGGPLPPASVMTVSKTPLDASPHSLLHSAKEASLYGEGRFELIVAACAAVCSGSGAKGGRNGLGRRGE